MVKMGAVLWSQIGQKIQLRDLSWALGLFGQNGDGIVLKALRDGGALDSNGILVGPLLARWLVELVGANSNPLLVWTIPARHPMFNSVGNSYTEAILNVINSSKQELIMTSPFIHERGISSLIKSLLDALGRGVCISMLTHHAEDLASSQSIAVEELRREACRLNKSLKIYTVESGLKSMLHAKLVIADREKMILGSANLTGPGLEQNVEAGIVLGSIEANEAVAVITGLFNAGIVKIVFDTGQKIAQHRTGIPSLVVT